VAALAVCAAGATFSAQDLPGGSPATVARVIDGDTLELIGGDRVRLLQIDTPELGSGECYSRRAVTELRALLPTGAPVGLRTDPRLDRHGHHFDGDRDGVGCD